MASNNILIVDDDPIVLSMLESALSKNGYHTLKSESGENALKILNAMEIDLVLFDVVLPGMDGLKTLKELEIILPMALSLCLC